MYLYEAAALGAATLWALTGLLSASPAQHLGAIAFNCTRMVLVAIMLCVVGVVYRSLEFNRRRPPDAVDLVRIHRNFHGRHALFLTLNRMGPRRTAMLFSLNCAHVGHARLADTGRDTHKRPDSGNCVDFSRRTPGDSASANANHSSTNGRVSRDRSGSVFCSALPLQLSQSVGSLIARPVMETGVDPGRGFEHPRWCCGSWSGPFDAIAIQLG